MIAWVWKIIVENNSRRQLSTKLIWIYLKTFIAKYIPGNVFHYVTRHIETSKEGVSHAILVQSNIIESVFLIFSSLFIIIVLFIIDASLVDTYISKYIDGNIIYVMLTIFMLFLLYLAFKNIVHLLYLLYYCVFFIGLGFITYCVSHLVLSYDISFFLGIFIFSGSWLVGTLMPGVPGGIGVRESMFILLCENILMDYEALLLAILLRVVTLGGEFICYLGATVKIGCTTYSGSEG